MLNLDTRTCHVLKNVVWHCHILKITGRLRMDSTYISRRVANIILLNNYFSHVSERCFSLKGTVTIIGSLCASVIKGNGGRLVVFNMDERDIVGAEDDRSHCGTLAFCSEAVEFLVGRRQYSSMHNNTNPHAFFSSL